MKRCEDCIHNKVCDEWAVTSGIPFVNADTCDNYKTTAEVAEVVRCKDCRFAKQGYLVNGLCLCEKTIYDYIKGEVPRNTIMEENDFCSYGERKE